MSSPSDFPEKVQVSRFRDGGLIGPLVLETDADLLRARNVETQHYFSASLVEELVGALAEAIQFGDEGWAYASDYFREKWEYERERAKLRAVLTEAQSSLGVKG